jgi:hypothetical protein
MDLMRKLSSVNPEESFHPYDTGKDNEMILTIASVKMALLIVLTCTSGVIFRFPI